MKVTVDRLYISALCTNVAKDAAYFLQQSLYLRAHAGMEDVVKRAEAEAKRLRTLEKELFDLLSGPEKTFTIERVLNGPKETEP